MKTPNRLALFFAAAALFVFLSGCAKRDGDSAPPGLSVPSSGDNELPPSAPAVPEDSRAALRADFSQINGLNVNPVIWGPGVRKTPDGRSDACVALQRAYGGQNALFIGPDEKVVYLTFDQGYENGYTESILNTLKAKKVSGAFFLTGHYLNSAPDLVRRMVDEGHTLGNHSYSHPDYTTLPPEDALDDMNRLHEAVYQQYGIDMRLFRFPSGVFSERMLGLAASAGYTSTFWSFAYADWDPANQMDPDAALKKALEGAHNGCIYLFHTVGKTNSLILGDLIDALRAAGYTIGAL